MGLGLKTQKPGDQFLRARVLLLWLASSAARAAIRSSSVIACQRVPRRSPVRRASPDASASRSRTSTWAGSASACLAIALVVIPSLSARILWSCPASNAFVALVGLVGFAGLLGLLGLRCVLVGAGADGATPLAARVLRASSSCAISPARSCRRVSMELTSWSMDVMKRMVGSPADGLLGPSEHEERPLGCTGGCWR